VFRFTLRSSHSTQRASKHVRNTWRRRAASNSESESMCKQEYPIPAASANGNYHVGCAAAYSSRARTLLSRPHIRTCFYPTWARSGKTHGFARDGDFVRRVMPCKVKGVLEIVFPYSGEAPLLPEISGSPDTIFPRSLVAGIGDAPPCLPCCSGYVGPIADRLSWK
jgi:hypothetical protein